MSEEKKFGLTQKAKDFLDMLEKRLDEGESEDSLAQEFEEWFKKYDDT
jgi:hypothetical protein